MKKFYRALTALIAAVAMLFAGGVVFAGTAMADAKYSITIENEKTGHSYKAYQIFSGTLGGNGSDDANPSLGNIQWGSGITEAGRTALIAKYLNGAEGKTAKDVADYLAANKGVVREFAELIGGKGNAAGYLGTVAGEATVPSDGKYVISGLSAGYYLVKDDSNLADQDDANSAYILDVVDNVTVKPKSETPTVDKKVHDTKQDGATSEQEEGNTGTDGWGETADHAINQSFQFKLTANLPADNNWDAYPTYKVVFTDTMSTGITFENIASVKVDGIAVSAGEANNQYQKTINDNTDAGANGTSWTLTINDIKSVTGESGKKPDLTDGATIEVIYNAHLNKDAQVTDTTGSATTNKNGVSLQYSNNPNGDGLGKTEGPDVYVYTFKIANTKMDGKGTEDTGDDTALANVGFRLYSDKDATQEIKLSKNTDGTYSPIADQANGEGVEMKSGSDGTFDIVGLDAGTYYLKETSPLPGYDGLPTRTITIVAKHKLNPDKTPTVDLTGSSNMSNKLVNQPGSSLPSTGGMGTMILYAAGIAVVVFAGLGLAVTLRKRQSRR
ncbi:isopeptide-forming domain-containing fimbrial protein [Bifidobacterium oedipodis]|uniref:Cell surface protein n=1 Tax=Bifidobacterium oedipodis TaxID=2675322 RepID=A0A7Y0HTZ9_9BIFI|nr:isopeptide-forming domain-containing fimbrial protein [Bifidobacterium sp. DSM 109957]NMM95133.1 cell surface protein [Bifidobacterium sp. DSM 109957]